MAQETLTVNRAFCPLDLLLFLTYRREVPGLLEATWALNPGLAELGPILPIGTKVLVEPPTRPRNNTQPRPLVTLWSKAS